MDVATVDRPRCMLKHARRRSRSSGRQKIRFTHPESFGRGTNAVVFSGQPGVSFEMCLRPSSRRGMFRLGAEGGVCARVCVFVCVYVQPGRKASGIGRANVRLAGGQSPLLGALRYDR